MSFSKAKLKRFNDVDVVCGSPAPHKVSNSDLTSGHLSSATGSLSGSTSGVSSTASSTTHSERKEQIEKFFKDAVRFASSNKDAKEFAVPKDANLKDDKKSKGLRLFRTPSLPQRLRFRHNTETTGHNNNIGSSNSTSSTPSHQIAVTPVKESSKSASRLKGKEALQHEIRKKNELLESYLSQIDVLKRHVDQLKDTELKLRDENESTVKKMEDIIQKLSAENFSQKEAFAQLSEERGKWQETCVKLETELKEVMDKHIAEIEAFNAISAELKVTNAHLESETRKQFEEHQSLQSKITVLEQEIFEAREKVAADEEKARENFELIQNLKNTNNALIVDVTHLKEQIEQDALSYAQETKAIQTEMDCLKNERNTLKHDLASKCEFILSLQEELLDKNCEIDAHCDTIRQLCREKAKYAEKERFIEKAEEKLRLAETQAEQKVQKLESDLETALEREKAYWRGELEKRQKLAENEIIKIELEKQDVMVLLETTNDMLRDRDEKIQKYEDQLRNGIDYYIQLTDNLQKQVVDLKQEIAKTITEKYNYQLTLNNTRSTVNILMERLKKSDADVEQFKAELESVQLAKGALEQSYLALQAELESLRRQISESESALKALRESSLTLQNEVLNKEKMFNDMISSEEETLAKFNKIASSFQERIDTDAANYLDLYNELKNKDESREFYLQDMKRTLDEFATVLQFAQLELDSKDKSLMKVLEECEQLKLENVTLKSKIDETTAKKENSTDLEKIEDLLIDSELRAECDKITSWLLSSADKSVRDDSTHEINDLLKPTTPNSNHKARVNTSSSAGKTTTTPRTPKTTHSNGLRTTPKKTVLFVGKENIPSPQKQVLKARNM